MIDLQKIKENIKKAQFASFTYRSKGTNELARHTLQLGVSYLNCLESSLLEARLTDQKDLDGLNLPESLFRQAKAKVIKSLRKSLAAHKKGEQSSDYTKKGLYIHQGKGITQHALDGSFEVHGLSHAKKVIEQGEYKTVKSRPLTIAKKAIEKRLTKSKWRTFSFENLEQAKLSGLTFEGSQANFQPFVEKVIFDIARIETMKKLLPRIKKKKTLATTTKQTATQH